MKTRKTAQLLAALIALPAVAQAVPLQLAHQGELSDSGGPVTDMVAITFELYTADAGGTSVWSEVRDVDVVDGHYAVLLGGSGQSTPVEQVLLQEPALYLQLTIDSAPLLPRQPVGSVPYAIEAHTAVNVDGGAVNASAISINGSEVVDSSGAWTAGAGSIPWSAVTDVPADEDTLGGLSCASGARPSWDAGLGLWDCDIVMWEEVGGMPAGFADGVDGDALPGLSCADQSVAKYDEASGQWVCGSDLVLTSAQVFAYVDGAALDLGAGSSLDGVDLATVDDLDWGLLSGVPAGFSDGIDNDSAAAIASYTVTATGAGSATATCGPSGILVGGGCQSTYCPYLHESYPSGSAWTCSMYMFTISGPAVCTNQVTAHALCLDLP